MGITPTADEVTLTLAGDDGESRVTLRPMDNPEAEWAYARQEAGGETPLYMTQMGRRAVIMSSLAENLPAKARARLLDAGIAPMQGLKECMLAIRAAAEVGAAQKCASTVLPIADVDAATNEGRILNEWESKLALSVFGLSVPQGAVCDADEVEAAAAEIGYPVCLKIASGRIAHKSDIGGVQLDLKNDNQIRKAQASMNHLASRFLVEKMVQAPVAELIVGIKRDAQFGLL